LSKFISKKQVVDTALNIVTSAGQKAGEKAVEFANSKWTPKSQAIMSKLVSSQMTAPATVGSPATAQATPNLNNLISGSGQQRAIKIQDLVRRLKK